MPARDLSGFLLGSPGKASMVLPLGMTKLVEAQLRVHGVIRLGIYRTLMALKRLLGRDAVLNVGPARRFERNRIGIGKVPVLHLSLHGNTAPDLEVELSAFVCIGIR